MKPANVIYGVVGGLAALLGFAVAFVCFVMLGMGFVINPYGVALAGVAGIYLCYRGNSAFKRSFGADVAEEEDPRSVEDRLDELERLKRREMVTMAEYAAKRADILKDL